LGLIILIFVLIVSAFVVLQNAKEFESDVETAKENKLSKKFIITVISSFAFMLIVFITAFLLL